MIPSVLEKTYNGERVYDLYSLLLKNRIIFINGEIDDKLANIVISELLYLDSINHEDISLYINSPGGSITSGMAIYDTMNYIKSDIKTISIGLSASMGAFLLASGSLNKRYSLPNSEIMIHEPLGGIQGKATDIEVEAKRILKLKNRINSILSKQTGKCISKIEKDTLKDNFMDPKEAIEYGLIDKIL